MTKYNTIRNIMSGAKDAVESSIRNACVLNKMRAQSKHAEEMQKYLYTRYSND